ncbi:MAG: 3-deoxy-8-phosphooctulonate synthase [Planctomycetota bacterium]|nr:MAG: 3-deoxy-8-phosphooctulonate synthase [Planctomycetota bacterium]
MVDTVTVKNMELGKPGELFLIAGPCVIESEDMSLSVAKILAETAEKHGIPLIFKSSYDKANRSNIKSYRGPGIELGLDILSKVAADIGLPVTTDVHTPSEAERAGKVVDIIQVPAFLSRQTDLLAAAGKTGKTVNVKKGQFLAPRDMKNVVEKIRSAGGKQILLTERGTSLGYNNLVADMRSIPLMQETGCPVVFDATHSVQLPGGRGSASGGEKQFVKTLACAAVAAGANGIFFEVHPDPQNAKCDPDTQLSPGELDALLGKLIAISKAAMPISGEK